MLLLINSKLISFVTLVVFFWNITVAFSLIDKKSWVQKNTKMSSKGNFAGIDVLWNIEITWFLSNISFRKYAGYKCLSFSKTFSCYFIICIIVCNWFWLTHRLFFSVLPEFLCITYSLIAIFGPHSSTFIDCFPHLNLLMSIWIIP